MTVPLIVVTGFLGAGKTTLINRLLARRSAAATGKLGVIVNELGAIGIDGTLLGGESARQIELPGGCVCCVLGDELDRTLIELVENNPGLEAIVLETTGAAEPVSIAWAVRRAPVDRAVRLAAVVTLVDASNFRASRPVSAAVDAQVAYADVVLITKAELATETAAVIAEVRGLAPRALVLEGTTDEHAAWLEQALAEPSESVQTGAPGHVHTDDCRHPDSAHGIDSVWVPMPAVVDLEELEDRLGELPANYVRIKGIARAVDHRDTDHAPHWVAVHRVGLRVSSEPIAAAAEGRIVALGPAVEVAELAACVEASNLLAES